MDEEGDKQQEQVEDHVTKTNDHKEKDEEVPDLREHEGAQSPGKT